MNRKFGHSRMTALLVNFDSYAPARRSRVQQLDERVMLASFSSITNLGSVARSPAGVVTSIVSRIRPRRGRVRS